MRASSSFWLDNSLDPSFPAFATASPPDARPSLSEHTDIALTVPQRELKRQRDLVRREAKAASRRRSATPGASSPSPSIAASATLDLPAFSPDPSAIAYHPHRPSSAASPVSSVVLSAVPSAAASPVPFPTAAAAAASAASAGSSPFVPSSCFPPPPPATVSMADLGAPPPSSSAGGSGPPGLYTTSAPPLVHGHGLGTVPSSYMAADSSNGGGGGGGGGGPYAPPTMQQVPGQDAGMFSAAAAGYQGQAYLPQYTTGPFGPPPLQSPPLQSHYPRGPMPDHQGLLYQMPPPPMLHHGQQLPPLPGAMPLQHGPVPPPPHYGHHPSLVYSEGGEGSIGGGGMLIPDRRQQQQQQQAGGRPKPQCWEHGCNGREFSTSSNLLRHQREKSGHAAKAKCPNCGAEFTRTTARNGHLQYEKCKARHK